MLYEEAVYLSDLYRRVLFSRYSLYREGNLYSLYSEERISQFSQWRKEYLDPLEMEESHSIFYIEKTAFTIEHKENKPLYLLSRGETVFFILPMESVSHYPLYREGSLFIFSLEKAGVVDSLYEEGVAIYIV